MAKKQAMVQPAPVKPAPKKKSIPKQQAWAFKDADLARFLQQLGNDRPYVILESSIEGWVLMFLGDSFPTLLRFKDGKPMLLVGTFTT